MTRLVGRFRLLATALAAVALVAPAVPAGAAATDPCNGAWTPALRDVTVNQGLKTYTPLARGKTTVVRLFLSAPSCAPALSEQLTGATLTVTDGVNTLHTVRTMPGSLGPSYPPLDSYSSAPTNNGSGNPIFQVPGLAAGSTASTVYFSATVTYQYQATPGVWTSGLVRISQQPGSTARIQASVAPAPHPLRVLVVPMGDASRPVSEQFPEARNGGAAVNGEYADTTVQNGMQTLSRLMPVADGVSDLTATTGGIRYRLNDAAMIDLGPSGLRLMNMPGQELNAFCGTAANFSYPTAGPNVAGKLAAFLSDWNSKNPSAQADRVVGAVWQGISRGVRDGCSEGMASVGGTQAWVRGFADTVVGLVTPNPSMTGALLGMELSHTFGGVPLSDSRDYLGDYHSKNVTADPLNTQRAYNTTVAQWMASPVSVMHYSGDSTGYTDTTAGGTSAWDNDSALFEREDYLFNQCQLTPGMTTTQCPSGTSIGSVGPSKAGGAFVLAGTTDGTKLGTVIHSYFDADTELTPAEPSSEYRLIQRDANGLRIPGPAGDQGVPARRGETEHDHNDAPSAIDVPVAIVNAAMAADINAAAFELWKGEPPIGSPACTPAFMPSGCVYARTVGDPPVITARTGASRLGNLQNYTNAAGDDTSPALSPDGRFVAWVTADGVVVQGRNTVTNQRTGARSAALAGALLPAWSLDGGRLAFATRDGDIDFVTVNTAVDPPEFGTTQVVYNHLLQTPPPLGSTAASHPSFSPGGDYLAVAINGGVWKIASSADVNPVLCRLATFVPTSTCSALAAEGGSPAWGAGDLVAFGKGGDIWTVNGDGGDPQLRVAGASSPAWGSNLVAFTAAGGVWVADSTVEDSNHRWVAQTRLTAAADVTPSLSGDGGAVAFDRSDATTRGHDVMVGTLDNHNPTFEFSATTTGDPRLLEADLYVTCAGAYEPIIVAIKPSSTSAGPPATATFTVTYDDSWACPGGTIYAQVTNGYSTSPLTPLRTIPRSPTGSDTPPPSPAISSPTPGSV